ncbi:hypothetical protein tb265_21730 [Gemmatimonadetes bacterium T265]|nr:hypothetical protein tb265_21730 [Gemmatimonadetes bacterium T265]
MPGANGVFVLAPLGGAAGERIAAIQREYDPKLAAESAPHVTLVGSSGTGPIDPSASPAAVRDALAPVLAAARPLALPFGVPERFPGTNVIALPLSPHGPVRELHDRIVEALARSRIPTAPGRFTFTPHATLSFYPTLAPGRARELLALRFAEPALVDRVEVSHTRAPQRPVTWFAVPLGAAAAGGAP